MSWFNQVKFFYTTTVTLLITFIWSVLLSIIFNQQISFHLFFFITVMSNIGRYLLRKGKNPIIIIVLSLLPIVVIEFLTCGELFFGIINIAFSSLLMVKLFKEEKNGISYDEYKRFFLHGIYYIFTSAVIYSFMKWSGYRAEGTMIYVGILVYIIMVVISLREAMGYEYQIKRTRPSKCINYGLALFGILITQNSVYTKIMYIGERVSGQIGNFISWLAAILFSIIKYPLMWLYSIFQWLIGGAKGKIPDMMTNFNSAQQELQSERVIGDGAYIINIIVAIIVILFVGMLFKVVSEIYYKASKSKIQEYTEFVEKIEVNKIKENKLAMKIKKLLRKKGTPREEVIYKYGELVNIAAKKDIFKGYMTPTQLKHIIKIKVNPSERIDRVTDLYNEAKFSTHSIGKQQQEFMEENVNKISKTMK